MSPHDVSAEKVGLNFTALLQTASFAYTALQDRVNVLISEMREADWFGVDGDKNTIYVETVKGFPLCELIRIEGGDLDESTEAPGSTDVLPKRNQALHTNGRQGLQGHYPVGG